MIRIDRLWLAVEPLVLDGETDVELRLREVGAGPYRPSGRYSVRPRSSKGLNPKCS